ncbi:MAG: hypothetical protein D6824_09595 [Planctomycetota bacterium]|nr:MAG: hypothetical protein D6824_09595 [Planctomycetota bacterium]
MELRLAQHAAVVVSGLVAMTQRRGRGGEVSCPVRERGSRCSDVFHCRAGAEGLRRIVARGPDHHVRSGTSGQHPHHCSKQPRDDATAPHRTEHTDWVATRGA